MPHIDVDRPTYDLVKAVAKREGRLLKAVVGRAVLSAYGTPEGQLAASEGARDAE
ncbi:hypothetical protein [Sinomonas soli]